ncbi:autoinducer 2 sensor kinase/phosphatase LuxQ [mine drainage metagenome]|uniref:histidine kinase n=1 Tax=mine drainage metagenome TaxID=410659 RepID=A0A1J5PYL9_9ZZZZ
MALFWLMTLVSGLWISRSWRQQLAQKDLLARQTQRISQNVLDLEQATLKNRKLAQAVEQSPVSIVITSREGIIEYVNPCFTRITGYSKEQVLGRTPGILQSGNTSRATYEELWRTILAGQIWRAIMQNRCQDGTLIWEDTSISPIVNEAGDFTHFVAVKEDVTERKQIEWQLQQHQTHLEELVNQRTSELGAALQAAKQAEKLKDEFLANITHELRTPLSAVIGFSNLARPLATEPRQRDYLDKVSVASVTLSGIINDLLDLSKIAAGSMVFETRAFSIRQLMDRCRSVISYKAQEKGLELHDQLDAAVPAVLLGDNLRLEQILLNLLSNAVKFTNEGRIELRVGVAERQEQRVCLVIEVQDSGIGLSEEGMTQLFKPFGQADSSITRRFGGTGLGLVICKHLAEMMQGSIGVTSRSGVGSTFRVQLWLAVGAQADLPDLATVLPSTMPTRYQDARVLVVDDQPFNRDVVAGLLAGVGISPHQATHGQEAIDILTQSPQDFDLVLMDIQMPVMDGLTAVRTLRSLSRFARLPVIAMTAHTMTHERELSSAAGMTDHIGKPFDEAHFYQVLAKWLPEHKKGARAADVQHPLEVESMPRLRGIDTHAGLALMLGDQARYQHWLRDFVLTAPLAIEQIRQAVTEGQNALAAQLAHALKGRTGMLGMRELHAVVALLEPALKQGQASADMLAGLERAVADVCAQIQAALAPAALPSAEGVPDPLPPGPTPACVLQLMERLQMGDSDCDLLIAACLAELKESAWVERLHRVLTHTQNFNYAAASALLADARQEQAPRMGS